MILRADVCGRVIPPLKRRGVLMNSLKIVAAAALIAGCSPFNTVPLSKDYTPYESFLRDREVCVQDAHHCIQKTYANSYYQGETADRLYPSRGVYLACMSSRGYYPDASGFIPPVLVKMTDYPWEKDCFAR
jgi:hypothetical protein